MKVFIYVVNSIEKSSDTLDAASEVATLLFVSSLSARITSILNNGGLILLRYHSLPYNCFTLVYNIKG